MAGLLLQRAYINLDQGNKIFHLALKCLKSAKKHWNNRSNIFKVNNKDIRMTSGAFIIINFEHILHFILLLILLDLDK